MFCLRRDRVRLGRRLLVVLSRAAGDHPHVNRSELAAIRGVNADGSVKAINTGATPWRQILTSPNMWWIALGYCCFFFGTNFT